MDADICRALRPAPLPPAAAAADPAAAAAAAAAAAELRGGGDPALLARVIAEHLYREGRFALGDALAAEAGLMDAEGLRAPYCDMHTVLEQVWGWVGAWGGGDERGTRGGGGPRGVLINGFRGARAGTGPGHSCPIGHGPMAGTCRASLCTGEPSRPALMRHAP